MSKVSIVALHLVEVEDDVAVVVEDPNGSVYLLYIFAK